MLTLALTACVHHSPDEALLAALGSQLQPEPGYPTPVYVVFEDRTTASVFRNIERDGRFRIAAKESRLSCPGDTTVRMHGFLLRASVDTVMGDSAIASIVETCAAGYQTRTQRTDYLLRRENDRWRVEKPLQRGISISAMPHADLP
jgi:hypothetical protein